MTDATDPAAGRSPAFARNPELEDLLAMLQRPLRAAEEVLVEEVAGPSMPTLLIVGSARTGSTLLLQLLARSQTVSYPSNFLSRFFAAPAVGALIQRMLFERKFQFRDELDLEGAASDRYESDLGKTAGALSPNEFLHFWRRWFECVDGHVPTDAAGVHFHEIRRELNALGAAWERPFALKAHLLNWILPVVSRELEDAIVISVRRERLYTAQSLLEARVRFFGSEMAWYSFKPPEFRSLTSLPVTSQVAAQVVLNERAVQEGIQRIDQNRVLEITYEDLTSNPAAVWERLSDIVARNAPTVDLGDPPRQEPFRSANVARLPTATLDAIRRALDDVGESVDELAAQDPAAPTASDSRQRPAR